MKAQTIVAIIVTPFAGLVLLAWCGPFLEDEVPGRAPGVNPVPMPQPQQPQRAEPTSALKQLNEPPEFIANHPAALAKWKASDTLERIQLEVAAKSVREYQMAKKNGASKTDLCVQAGLMAAAWLQAEDEHSYRDAKAIERKDCEAAGIPQ